MRCSSGSSVDPFGEKKEVFRLTARGTISRELVMPGEEERQGW